MRGKITLRTALLAIAALAFFLGAWRTGVHWQRRARESREWAAIEALASRAHREQARALRRRGQPAAAAHEEAVAAHLAASSREYGRAAARPWTEVKDPGPPPEPPPLGERSPGPEEPVKPIIDLTPWKDRMGPDEYEKARGIVADLSRQLHEDRIGRDRRDEGSGAAMPGDPRERDRSPDEPAAPPPPGDGAPPPPEAVVQARLRRAREREERDARATERQRQRQAAEALLQSLKSASGSPEGP